MPTPQITFGYVIKENDGLVHGRLRALGLAPTNVVFTDSLSFQGKSYFKIIADPLGDAYEIGVAFFKEKDGRRYYSVRLDSPFLAAPIYGAMFADRYVQNRFNLVWSRGSKPNTADPQSKSDNLDQLIVDEPPPQPNELFAADQDQAEGSEQVSGTTADHGGTESKAPQVPGGEAPRAAAPPRRITRPVATP